MGAPFLIIDGYNLMHAVGMARADYGPGELEKHRTRFLNRLAREFEPDQRARTTVVFDAANAPPGAPRSMVVEGIEVRFAVPGGDADSLIEELIAAHSAPRRLVVVSGDRRLQKAARRRRAKFVDGEEFMDRLRREAAKRQRARQRDDETPPARRGGKLPPREVAEWMEEFGPVPEARPLETGPHADEVEFWQSRLDELEEE